MASADAPGRWSKSARFALESLTPGASTTEVARKNEINTGQLYTWREQLVSGELDGVAAAPPRFLRVDLAATARGEQSAELPSGPAPSRSCRDMCHLEGLIEIVLPSGACVRVGSGADIGVLGQIVAMLRGRFIT